MTSDTFSNADSVSLQKLQSKLQELSTDELEEVQTTVVTELEERENTIDLDDAESVTLVSGQWVRWRNLSAHPNLKAVNPWIMQVTGTHEKYGVDGDWLDKQRIDGDYHMDVTGLESGDIIKVSGASHNNRKHRYYRIITMTDDQLYYEPRFGLQESRVIEEVG